MNGRFLRQALGAALALTALTGTANAGIPGGVAIVLGFHCVPAPGDGSIPWPRSPEDLSPRAFEPGEYDVWLFLHTRAPLVGAWTMTAALACDLGPGGSIEILDWTRFTDGFIPYAGFPAPGASFRAEWWRGRCMDPDRYMNQGRDGWWVQPVLKLRVRVSGPVTVTFGDPEPGVRPQLIECADEMHELDGTDGWSRVIPAVFGEAGPARTGAHAPSPVEPKTWGAIKALHGGSR